MKTTKKTISSTSSKTTAIPKLVKVEWTDAVASVGWSSDYAEEKTHRIHSVGYVIKETEEDIVLAADVSTDNESLDTNRRMSIPVKWIKSRKEIKL